MAAVGADATSLWFLSSGGISVFILLLLLTIFLTALCSDCGRRSFELQDLQIEKSPSALVKVVKLEEVMVARENPMINEIQNDEKSEVDHGKEPTEMFTPWRSHLVEPQNNQDVVTSTAPDSTLYDIIPKRHSGVNALSLPLTNQRPRPIAAVDTSDLGGNAVYAQISRKAIQATPTNSTSEQVEELSPPLPDRTLQME